MAKKTSKKKPAGKKAPGKKTTTRAVPLRSFKREVDQMLDKLRLEKTHLLDDEIPPDLIVRNLNARHDRLHRLDLSVNAIEKLAKVYETPAEDDLKEKASPLFNESDGEEDQED